MRLRLRLAQALKEPHRALLDRPGKAAPLDHPPDLGQPASLSVVMMSVLLSVLMSVMMSVSVVMLMTMLIPMIVMVVLVLPRLIRVRPFERFAVLEDPKAGPL